MTWDLFTKSYVGASSEEMHCVQNQPYYYCFGEAECSLGWEFENEVLLVSPLLLIVMAREKELWKGTFRPLIKQEHYATTHYWSRDDNKTAHWNAGRWGMCESCLSRRGKEIDSHKSGKSKYKAEHSCLVYEMKLRRRIFVSYIKIQYNILDMGWFSCLGREQKFAPSTMY